MIARASAGPSPTHAPSMRHEHPINGAARCACCGRFPLVGEWVTGYGGGSGSAERLWSCETCESGGRAQRLGSPIDRDRVRSLGGAANVRRAA